MKVYHVELTVPFEGQTHFYFGSQAAIFDLIPVELLGIKQKSLTNNVDLEATDYKNSYCTIRLGEFHRKKTNRGRSKK